MRLRFPVLYLVAVLTCRFLPALDSDKPMSIDPAVVVAYNAVDAGTHIVDILAMRALYQQVMGTLDAESVSSAESFRDWMKAQTIANPKLSISLRSFSTPGRGEQLRAAFLAFRSASRGPAARPSGPGWTQTELLRAKVARNVREGRTIYEGLDMQPYWTARIQSQLGSLGSTVTQNGDTKY